MVSFALLNSMEADKLYLGPENVIFKQRIK